MNRKGEPLYPLDRPCPSCGEKDPQKFHYHQRKTGTRVGTEQRHKYCKNCTYEKKVSMYGIYQQTKANKNKQRSYKYNIQEEQLQQLYLAQEGRCAICREWYEYTTMNVDHDHVSKMVRGFLCSHCNRGLGCFLDDSDLLRKAADYIDFYDERK